MHRTGFSDIVGALSPAEQTQLQVLVGTPDSELWQLLARTTDLHQGPGKYFNESMWFIAH